MRRGRGNWINSFVPSFHMSVSSKKGVLIGDSSPKFLNDMKGRLLRFLFNRIQELCSLYSYTQSKKFCEAIELNNMGPQKASGPVAVKVVRKSLVHSGERTAVKDGAFCKRFWDFMIKLSQPFARQQGRQRE